MNNTSSRIKTRKATTMLAFEEFLKPEGIVLFSAIQIYPDVRFKKGVC